MNYKRIYNELIEKRITNPITSGYKENHHILPKSLSGDNSKENMVYLTAREHYVAHLLLHKFMKCSQTSYALWMMQMKPCVESDRIPFIKGSRMYEWARKEFVKYIGRTTSKHQTGKGNSQYGKIWISNLDLKESKTIKNTDEIPNGWIKGRNKWNNPPRVKLKKAYCITNGVKNKRLFYDDQIIPTGWTLGRTFTLTEKGKQSISKSTSASNINRLGIKYNKTASVG